MAFCLLNLSILPPLPLFPPPLSLSRSYLIGVVTQPPSLIHPLCLAPFSERLQSFCLFVLTWFIFFVFSIFFFMLPLFTTCHPLALPSVFQFLLCCWEGKSQCSSACGEGLDKKREKRRETSGKGVRERDEGRQTERFSFFFFFGGGWGGGGNDSWNSIDCFMSLLLCLLVYSMRLFSPYSVAPRGLGK